MNILKQNFFELFDIPVSIEINNIELDRKYKILQQQFHPDNFLNSTNNEKRISLQLSSKINDGYIILSSLISRIEYILQINNFIQDESKTIQDDEFLSEQIKLNECLENIDSNNVNLKKHKLEINDSIDKLTNIINSNIRDKNFSEAWVNLAKIKFYNNHLNHIEKYISL
tara:strand:- start:1719 stop:2228 length:510 start_codon:yes stop_codon:yes gene_type:complete